MNNRFLRAGIFLLLAAGIALAVMYRDRFDVAALEVWIQDAGIWVPLLFMLVYAVAAVLFLPGSVLTLAGGALFGPVLGTFYNLTGATSGAALAFLIARYLASDWVADKTGRRAMIDIPQLWSKPLRKGNYKAPTCAFVIWTRAVTRWLTSRYGDSASGRSIR